MIYTSFQDDFLYFFGHSVQCKESILESDRIQGGLEPLVLATGHLKFLIFPCPGVIIQRTLPRVRRGEFAGEGQTPRGPSHDPLLPWSIVRVQYHKLTARPP